MLLCGVGSVPGDCDIEASKTRFGPRIGVAYRPSNKWVVRAGYGLTNDPYEAMELIRANYPILIQVKLESPDGLTPARTLSQGIPSFQVPAEGNGILDIPERLRVDRVSEGPGPRLHPVVERHGPTGAARGASPARSATSRRVRSVSSGSSTSTPAR